MIKLLDESFQNVAFTVFLRTDLADEYSLHNFFKFHSGAYSHLVKKGRGLSTKMDRKNYLKI